MIVLRVIGIILLIAGCLAAVLANLWMRKLRDSHRRLHPARVCLWCALAVLVLGPLLILLSL